MFIFSCYFLKCMCVNIPNKIMILSGNYLITTSENKKRKEMWLKI